jgi:predicted O-methyltransferase YrrM
MYPERWLRLFTSLLARHVPPRPSFPGADTDDRAITSASICPHTAAWLWWYLIQTKPGVIVEFGSGYSTTVLGAFSRVRAAGGAVQSLILSAEHDAEWYALQRQQLHQTIIDGHVHLLHSPLEKQIRFGREVTCYSNVDKTLASLTPDGCADFLFLDGPPGTAVGGVGREGSILQAIQLVRPGGLILIHDAIRSEELRILTTLHLDRKINFHCKGIIPVQCGLAICTSDPSMRH